MTRSRLKCQQGAAAGGRCGEAGLAHRGEPAGGPLQVVGGAQGGV